MRNTTVPVGLISLFILSTSHLFACTNHPSMTHEQYTTAMQSKYGEVISFSNKFFSGKSSQPAPAQTYRTRQPASEDYENTAYEDSVGDTAFEAPPAAVEASENSNLRAVKAKKKPSVKLSGPGLSLRSIRQAK